MKCLTDQDCRVLDGDAGRGGPQGSTHSVVVLEADLGLGCSRRRKQRSTNKDNVNIFLLCQILWLEILKTLSCYKWNQSKSEVSFPASAVKLSAEQNLTSVWGMNSFLNSIRFLKIDLYGLYIWHTKKLPPPTVLEGVVPWCDQWLFDAHFFLKFQLIVSLHPYAAVSVCWRSWLTLHEVRPGLQPPDYLTLLGAVHASVLTVPHVGRTCFICEDMKTSCCR